ncbi:hypothetical protein [uncultured Weeksella sp.]|uniref:hypothetical protein n=1 Tax=uncultured Weeksella sp. TaxID=1161389 RepID=UPI00259BAD31|nr:hypothetical protein [uncultured Weeksella sp.]
MKRNIAIVFFIGGLLAVTSCDKIKEAYHDTFNEDKQTKLERIYNTPGFVDNEEKEKLAEYLYNEALKLMQEKELEDPTTLRILQEYKEINFVEPMKNRINELKEAPKNFLADPDKLKAIQQELQDLFPNKQLQISGGAIMINQNMVYLDLVDPENPEYVDNYTYRKVKNEFKWVKGDPVKSHRISKKTQPIVDFSTANKLFLVAKEKMKTIEGANKPKNVYYYLHNQKWQTTIDAAREDYIVQTDTNGNLTEFKKL